MPQSPTTQPCIKPFFKPCFVISIVTVPTGKAIDNPSTMYVKYHAMFVALSVYKKLYKKRDALASFLSTIPTI